ncbi:MAG: SHOCT domain-containing protein [Motilibacteraceae bacterium]
MRRRPLVRAAAVGGAAYYMGKRSQRAGQAEAEQDARLSDLEAQQQPAPAEPQYAPPPPPPAAPSAPPADGGTDVAAQLAQLAQLHQSGALTDDEFATAKTQLLGG